MYSLINFCTVSVPMESAARIKKQNISCTQKFPVCLLWKLPHKGNNYLYHHSLVLDVFQFSVTGNLQCVVYKSSFFCLTLNCPHYTKISVPFVIHKLTIHVWVTSFLTLLVHWSILFLHQQHIIYTNTSLFYCLIVFIVKNTPHFLNPLYCWWKFRVFAVFNSCK